MSPLTSAGKEPQPQRSKYSRRRSPRSASYLISYPSVDSLNSSSSINQSISTPPFLFPRVEIDPLVRLYIANLKLRLRAYLSPLLRLSGIRLSLPHLLLSSLSRCLPVSVFVSSRTPALLFAMRSIALAPDAASRPRMPPPPSHRAFSSVCGTAPLVLRRCISGTLFTF